MVDFRKNNLTRYDIYTIGLKMLSSYSNLERIYFIEVNLYCLPGNLLLRTIIGKINFPIEGSIDQILAIFGLSQKWPIVLFFLVNSDKEFVPVPKYIWASGSLGLLARPG